MSTGILRTFYASTAWKKCRDGFFNAKFGLCEDCGSLTIGAKRKQGIVKSYVCTTYNKYGKAYCSGHKISHDDLDIIV
ncbi:hypothetical protein SBF1_3700003 [Candidatus Desulfosporosinus infrequens]|uniref:Recombinase zinc beta ribbon domain-containing protein n=1 Tax=Candidatus Desulfosporosinus infrequens TaxID=2043169 RepID=A0A2U3L4Q7_9FIRM|nr:hypothetical protein SBF1_3700003 [Candidatus Desulfosporosinus infrequens]